MSTFACPIVRIDAILPHGNADLLELAQVKGWRAVVGKGLHQPGDPVVYIPTDAVLPVALTAALGYEGKLSGPQKNRVKTVKLRGEVSQGLVVPLKRVFEVLLPEFPDWKPAMDRALLDPEPVLGQNLAEMLGITKWEAPIPVHMQGQVITAPEWFRVFYDLENVKNWPGVLQHGEDVLMTEKIHGTNMRVGVHRREGMFVASRGRDRALQQDDSNLYWRATKQFQLGPAVERLLDVLNAEWVILFGEVFGAGVQDLQYGCAANQIEFRAFDLRTPEGWVAPWTMRSACDAVGIPLVPVVYTGPYSPEALAAATDGKDFSRSHMREGVVVRPAQERQYEPLGRVVLKSISVDYELRKNGTEHH